MPTQQQLEQVKLNAGNMIDLSNQLHDYMQDPVSEVYDFLSADASADSGFEFVCALLETAFAVAALVEFPGAAVAGAFLPVFFSAASPPDVDSDLKNKFGATWARLSKTFLAANLQLAEIRANPGGYWDKSFTSPVTNKQTLVSSLGDAAVTVPARQDVEFQEVTNRVIAQFRQDLTKSVLVDQYWVYFSSAYSDWRYQTKDQFFQDASAYTASWPAYFFKYRLTWKTKDGVKEPVVQYYNFSLCPKGSAAYTASNEMCGWLFQDNGYGHQTNPDGVGARSSVFFSWGLQVYYPDGKPFGIDEAVTSLAVGVASSEPPKLEGSGEGPMQGPPAQGAQT